MVTNRLVYDTKARMVSRVDIACGSSSTLRDHITVGVQSQWCRCMTCSMGAALAPLPMIIPGISFSSRTLQLGNSFHVHSTGGGRSLGSMATLG